MYLSNPFRKSDADTRSAWGYTFQLTDNHPTPKQMDSMKHCYDVLGEKVLQRLGSISSPLRSTLPRDSIRDPSNSSPYSRSTSGPPPDGKRDLYLLLQQNASNDEILGQLWAQVNTVPSWVCWDQIARGQDCFYRYGGPMLNGLAFQSLLGGMVRLCGPFN